MEALGPLEDDPDEIVLSRLGAEIAIRDLAQTYMDLMQQGPNKNGWRIVRDQLEEINKAAATLHRALSSTAYLTVLALERTGSQMDAPEWFKHLKQLQSDVLNALEIIPANNQGDAVTALCSAGTPNETLVLGCQNVMFACRWEGKIGIKPGGHLEDFTKLVARLALGEKTKAGGISAAMRCEEMKGRYKSKGLRLEAYDLILGDAIRRRGPDSELAQRIREEQDRLTGDTFPG
jgi:hypothetical protein